MPVRHGDPGDMVFPGRLRPGGLPAVLPAPERLAAVRATGLLDTGPEGPFDDLARLAGAATAPGRTRCGGNQGARPAPALISVPQRGRRLDTTPP